MSCEDDALWAALAEVKGAVMETCGVLIATSLAVGIYAVLTVMAVCLLCKHGQAYAARWISLIYIGAMLTTTIIWYTTATIVYVNSLISPVINQPLTTTVAISEVLQYLLSDGLILYRTYMVYHQNLKVLLLPGLAYIASGVFGVFMNPSIGRLSQDTEHKLAIAFVTATITCNTYVSAALIYKIQAVVHNKHRCKANESLYIEKRARADLLFLTAYAMLYIVIGILPVVSREVATATNLALIFQIMTFLGPAIFILCKALTFSNQSKRASLPTHDTDGSLRKECV